MSKAKSDFYQQLRTRLSGWMKAKGSKHQYAEYVLLAPDLFHLLCKLSVDKRVPVAEKARLAAAIAYFVSPVDLIPEAVVGPIGYVDDVALAAYVLNSIVNTTSPAVVRAHWAGDGDVLVVIRRILEVADEMVGSGLWKTLQRVARGVATSGVKKERARPSGASRGRR